VHHPFIPSSFEEGKPSRFMVLFNMQYLNIGTEGWWTTLKFIQCVTSVTAIQRYEKEIFEERFAVQRDGDK
jgi:hypothetical protein